MRRTSASESLSGESSLVRWRRLSSCLAETSQPGHVALPDFSWLWGSLLRRRSLRLEGWLVGSATVREASSWRSSGIASGPPGVGAGRMRHGCFAECWGGANGMPPEPWTAPGRRSDSTFSRLRPGLPRRRRAESQRLEPGWTRCPSVVTRSRRRWWRGGGVASSSWRSSRQG
jgi:hypothetical protein